MRPVELTVISGKGGTGKTSLSASLALLAANPVVADCDVDAADLHILLKPERERDDSFMAGLEASIDPDLCTGCGVCRGHCRFQAINRGADKRYQINPFLCEGCRACLLVCPYGAVKMEQAESGRLYQSKSSAGPMVHASLHPGADNSGKLVTVVRREAARIYEKEDKSVIITDGPPGIGCPVLATLTGTSLVLVVTEPTLSGFHDLKRVVQVINHFNLPAGVCINRWDINPEVTEQIEEYIDQEFRLYPAGRIAYSRAFIETQLSGVPVVASATSAAEEVKKVWKRMIEIGAENGIRIE